MEEKELTIEELKTLLAQKESEIAELTQRHEDKDKELELAAELNAELQTKLTNAKLSQQKGRPVITHKQKTFEVKARNFVFNKEKYSFMDNKPTGYLAPTPEVIDSILETNGQGILREVMDEQ